MILIDWKIPPWKLHVTCNSLAVLATSFCFTFFVMCIFYSITRKVYLFHCLPTAPRICARTRISRNNYGKERATVKMSTVSWKEEMIQATADEIQQERKILKKKHVRKDKWRRQRQWSSWSTRCKRNVYGVHICGRVWMVFH